MHITKSWIAVVLLLSGVAGCQNNVGRGNPPAAGAYGSNNTLDPGDITGSGTSGNIRGVPGFAPATRPAP